MASAFFRSIFFCFLLLASQAAGAVPMQSVPAPARSGFIPVAAEIGQQIQALVTGDANAEIEPQETFGTRALGLILDSIKLVSSESSTFASNFAAWPQLTAWVDQQINDPVALERWGGIGELLLLVVGVSFAAGWLADLILLPVRRKIYRRHFTSAWSRFGGIFMWLLLSFVPVIVFIGAALAVIDANDPTKLARFIVMTVVYALAVFRLVRVFFRFFLAPHVPNLRFLPLSTSLAVYVQNWVSWFSAVIIVRYFVAEVAKVVKVPLPAVLGFTSIAALVIVIMTIVVIVQKRSAISLLIRGDLSAAQAHGSLIDTTRLWFARTWHVMAISYLVIGYLVTMLGAEGGFAIMMSGTIGTLMSLVVMRLAFFFISKISYKKHDGAVTSGIYRPVLRVLLRLAVWALGLAGVLASWGMDIQALLASAWGQRVMGSVFSITSTLLIVVFVYELLSSFIENKLHYKDSKGQLVQANSRARTLLPMVQKAAIMVLTVIVGLVTLSELGINIAPLLAGAGVLGVALGFGSQTLVKDFLTGLSIILEDNLAVGDSVIIGGNKGIVENLSIRTVRLRDVNGSLHIMPFSEITTITNESKAFAYALMDVGVSYDSDLDKVATVMKRTGAEMRKDPSVSSLILDDIEVMGVEALGDSSIVMRSRIRTKAGQQGIVRRGYLLRIKNAFDAEKIEIPFPTVMHMTRGG